MPALLPLAALALIVAALVYQNQAVAACGGSSVAASGGTSGNGFAVNNPGNLRYIAPPNNFNGQNGQTASGIGKYDTLQDGCRAMFLQLAEYVNDGLTTITQIITKWAPPTENPTAAYIADVSAATHIDPDSQINWISDGPQIQYAMIVQENGQAIVDQYNFSESDLLSLLQNAGVLNA